MEFTEHLEAGGTLDFEEFQDLLDSSEPEKVHELSRLQAANTDEIDAYETVKMFQARDFARAHGMSPEEFEDRIESYFRDHNMSENHVEGTAIGLPDNLSARGVVDGLHYIKRAYDEDEQARRRTSQTYLKAADSRITWI